MQKRPVPGSSGAFMARRPHLERGTEIHPGCKKSAGSGVFASSANSGKKGAMGVSTPDVSQSIASSLSSSSFSLRLVSLHIFGSVEKHYF